MTIYAWIVLGVVAASVAICVVVLWKEKPWRDR